MAGGKNEPMTRQMLALKSFHGEAGEGMHQGNRIFFTTHSRGNNYFKQGLAIDPPAPPDKATAKAAAAEGERQLADDAAKKAAKKPGAKPSATKEDAGS